MFKLFFYILIPGLSRHKTSSPEDLLRLLQYGNGNRTQHPTDANKESSRSHAVFQVYIKQTGMFLGKKLERHSLNLKKCLSNFLITEESILMKEMAKKCSTDQRFILKEKTSYPYFRGENIL